MSQLNYKIQDDILLKDILQRNYFSKFTQGIGSINLSFYSNSEINNEKFIPEYIDETLTYDINIILKQLAIFLRWYKKKQFNCYFIINDKMLCEDKYLLNFNKILSVFRKLNITQKIIINLYENNKIDNNFLKKLKDIYPNIEFILNIDILNINYFINIKNFVKYKIYINPNDFTSLTQLITNYDLIIKNQLQIDKYIEFTSDKWTEEKIIIYLQFINYLLNSIQDFNTLLLSTNSLINIKDFHVIDNKNCKADCSFQQSLNIFINNLSINLCHNFQYDDQIIGKFIIKDNEIINIESKIIELIILNTHLKRSSTPHCESCNIVGLCHGFCYAQAYQKSLNPIIPIKEFCDLQKAKYTYILKFLIQNNLINENVLLDCYNKNFISNIYFQYLKNLYNALKV